MTTDVAAEAFTVDTTDGCRLAGTCWRPAGPPRAVVQVLHGMAEHQGRYDGLVQALTSWGYGVVIHDHRGHGATVSEARGHMADVDGWEKVVTDARRVTAVARDAFPGAPVFLLGHSWGSLLARDYATRWGDGLAGLVVVATAGDPGPKGRAGVVLARAMAVAGRRRPNRVLDRLVFDPYNKQFEPCRTRFDWLNTDGADVDAYLADPDCGFVCSTQFFLDLARATQRLSARRHAALVPTDLPVLVLAGADDPVGANGAGPRAVATMLGAAGVGDVECHVYPGMRHEILRERERDLVLADLRSWLGRHVGAEGGQS